MSEEKLRHEEGERDEGTAVAIQPALLVDLLLEYSEREEIRERKVRKRRQKEAELRLDGI